LITWSIYAKTAYNVVKLTLIKKLFLDLVESEEMVSMEV
jgi:hypothetical protein